MDETMDKTNYQLLSVVAIVAVTGIVSMFIHAQSSSGLAAGPQIVFEDGRAEQGNALTGFVVGDQRATREASTEERPRPALDWRAYDYNSDGVVDESDVRFLEQVIARNRFCPPEKSCDMNGDGVVDSSDRTALLATIFRLDKERSAPKESAPPAQIVPSSSGRVGIAAAGVPFK